MEPSTSTPTASTTNVLVWEHFGLPRARGWVINVTNNGLATMEINDRKYNKHSRHQLQLTLSELDLLMSAIRKSDPASIKKKENPAIVLDGSRNKLIFMGGTVAFSSQQPPAESDKQRWVDIILAFRDLEIWQNVILEIKYKNFPAIGKPHFLLGHFLQMRRESKTEEISQQLDFFMKNTSAPLIRMHLMWRPMILVRDPELLKHALIDVNLPKGMVHRQMSSILGEGLVFSNYEKWATHRKALLPLFSPTFLKRYLSAFQRHTKRFLEIRADSIDNPFELLDENTKLTMDIISDVAFGYKLNAKEPNAKTDSKLLHSIKRIFGLTSNPLFYLIPWSRYYFAWKVRADRVAIDGVIRHAIADYKSGKSDPECGQLLKYVLECQKDENGVHFTFEEIRDEMITFFVAGHETTALTLTWLLFELTRNPNVLEKIQAEIDTVLGNREMTVDDLPKLKYMTMALKETLRMYPAAVILSRAVPKGFRLGDHELPDFATLWIAVWSFHRDEKMWPNPNRFDPEKFADEKQLPHVVSCNEQTEKTKQDEEEEPIIRRRRRRSTKEYKEEEEEMKKAEEEKKRRKVTFFFFFFLFFYVGMPFSLGPRNCIGRDFFWIEAKVILSATLRRFSVELLPNQIIEPTSRYGTTKPKNGVHVRFIPRKTA